MGFWGFGLDCFEAWGDPTGLTGGSPLDESNRNRIIAALGKTPIAPTVPTPAPVTPAVPAPVATDNTNAASDSAPTVPAPVTVTITEQAQMETLANGDVSGFADATKGSQYTFVKVQGSQLVLQDAQGKQYLIDLSATDYVAPK